MLYNDFRPKNFDEIIGNEEEKQILKGIIKNKSYKIRKQYIFSSNEGGVGKTTSALIMARAINCIDNEDGNPCNECESCKSFLSGTYPDFISINGAEYNQVDKVKPIIEIAKTIPIKGRDNYRVIVINEAQRMSPQAMSEFLDPFEFSVDNTIFILTTTSVKQIPQPIISRTLEFNFSPPTNKEIISLLNRIDGNISTNRLSMFVNNKYTDGSVRNILSEFEKYKLSGMMDLVGDNKYNEMANLIMLCLINGVHNYEDRVYKYGDNLVKSINEILIDLLSDSPKVLETSVHDKIKKSLPKGLLKQFIKDYMKYKVYSTKEMVLLLYLYDDFSINIDKSDETSIMETFGFIKGGG